MKKISIVSMLALSLIISAQNIEKKCKSCGKLISQCQYKGKHPKVEDNKLNNDDRQRKQRRYVVRVETKRPGEEYEIKGTFGSSGLALVKLRGKYGFINKEGVEIVPLKYDAVCDGHFSYTFTQPDAEGWKDNYVLMSVSQNQKWGYINQKGELIVPPIYDMVYRSVVLDKENSIFCCKDGKFGVLGQDGTIRIPFIYDKLEDIEWYEEVHPRYARKNSKYGYIDENNNIIAPFKYTNAYRFPNNGSLALVCENDKFGFIDLNGKEAIPLKYEHASSFDFVDDKLENAIAAVVVNKKVGFINGKSDEVISCQYENELRGYDNHKYISGGFDGAIGVVKKNGKWGVINRKGEVLVPFQYDDYVKYSPFEEFRLRKDGEIFYFDKGGNIYTTEKERNDSSTIRLARKGFPTEQAWIGEYYYRGSHGYPEDYAKALYWFEKAAKQDNGKALYFLGWMYEHGQGVKKDYTVAENYYKKCISVSKDYRSGSLLRLGHIHYYGNGVEENYSEAYAYFFASADLGDSEALYYIGWMYEHGQGVGKKDIEKAKEFYRKSAEKGYDKAKEKIAKLK